jgi:acetyltransferase-like isoleucine patch superfamily enzyme
LRQFGAHIGERAIIHGPLIIHNAAKDYGNLNVGANVHIGRVAVLDLSAPLIIQDDATVSMGVTILTHADVGGRPLKSQFPRYIESTTIGATCYIGANATILAGCNIRSEAVVGAGAVVTESIPDSAVAVGIPAKVVRTIEAGPAGPVILPRSESQTRDR